MSSIIIPDSWMEIPELMEGRKPTVNVVIDQEHWFGKTVETHLLLNNSFKDTVRGLDASVSNGGSFTVGTKGIELDDWGVNSHLRLPAPPSINNGKGSLCIWTTGLNGTSFNRIAQGGGVGYNNTIIYRNGSNSSIGFRLNGSTQVLETKGAGAINDVGDIFISNESAQLTVCLVFSWDVSRSIRRLYANGVMVDSDTSNAFTVGGWGDELNLFADSSGANDFSGRKHQVVFSNKFLSLSEAVSLYNNPYQFLSK